MRAQLPILPMVRRRRPANKLFETGRFDATETMHRRFTRQFFIDELTDRLEYILTNEDNKRELN